MSILLPTRPHCPRCLRAWWRKLRRAIQRQSTALDGPPSRTLNPSKVATMSANFLRHGTGMTSSGMCLPFCLPPLVRSPLRGYTGAQRHSLFCFGFASLRVTVSLEILFASTRKDLSGPSVNAELRHLGAGPTRKASPGVTRTRSRIQ